MIRSTERVLGDLQNIVGELEVLMKHTAKAADVGASGVVEQVHAGIVRARERVKALEGDLLHQARHGARKADRYVRDNAWISIAAAAVIGFALGAVVGHRD